MSARGIERGADGIASALHRVVPRSHSVLLVPIALPSGLLPSPRRSLLRAAIPHHVTILYPFVPPADLDGDVVAAVARVARQHSAFDFALASTDHFPNVTFMTVEPSEPFLALIDSFQRAWPQYPRYDDKFTTVIPHVTIAARPHPPAVEERVAARLPVQTVADSVEIWRSGLVRGWRCHARVELAQAT